MSRSLLTSSVPLCSRVPLSALFLHVVSLGFWLIAPLHQLSTVSAFPGAAQGLSREDNWAGVLPGLAEQGPPRSDVGFCSGLPPCPSMDELSLNTLVSANTAGM